jgi:hypothetical protein
VPLGTRSIMKEECCYLPDGTFLMVAWSRWGTLGRWTAKKTRPRCKA